MSSPDSIEMSSSIMAPKKEGADEKEDVNNESEGKRSAADIIMGKRRAD